MQTHRARKRFGQHFLHDTSVVARIVRAIGARPGERLVEIGPGLGALTGALLESCENLDVIELDRDLAAKLRADYQGDPRLRVHTGDALKFDFRQLAAPGERLRVVGNLPYNVSTPLLFHLLDQAAVIEDMYFMLQREVVGRLVAQPGGKDYGRLTVMVRLNCDSEKLFDVGAGAFRPAPRVTSAVVHLRVRRDPAVALVEFAAFKGLVTHLFSRRRKTLRNSLRGRLSESELESLGIDPNARPETLDLSAFAVLANALADTDSDE
ncbi:MAG: 16S rRNA (adenine(1518)-N(6)/adenine(1519)-N(6))-dimethyltransferase RsmA [Gammaproteobacteria bacterium]|nr:16S rRNA (adenine(1518)-N(6)/adenine(1519)-N(6))-dimethyltransferase RsmA [Gammaproteobacteria bacterium]MDX2460793.1 16S rRNA (adenine(1518)-N(6)/adenine(1519)-N(6))-dimethyltransferase RsmA [Gammaproteobacteria bacterium]